MKLLLKIVVLLLFGSLLNQGMTQTLFTKYAGNPILDEGITGSWDDAGVNTPVVIYESGMYKMWYSGYDGTNWNIGYATSEDGIEWTKYAENPVISVGGTGSWDEKAVGSGPVLFDGETYRMWFFGVNNSIIVQVGYATSSDGVNWTKNESPVMTPGDAGDWDAERVLARTVLIEDELYKMWFHGQNDNKRQIGYATSPDGINWTKHENNPVVKTGATGLWDDQMVFHPVVISHNENYLMWYGGLDGQIGRTGFATSEDGITWEKYPYNPIIDVGKFADWDYKEIWPSTVIFEDSLYKMWCSGYSSAYEYAIGYTTAPVNINVPWEQPTIQSAIDVAKDGNVVLVEEGTYYENINFRGKKITVASHYLIEKDTTHISSTIIDGSQHQNPDSGSVVYMVSDEDTNSVLCGFTITGGTGTKNFWNDDEMRTGGGITIWNSGAKIQHNHIINNSIDLVKEGIYCYGAGMDVFSLENQTVVICDNLFKNNNVNSWWGGGAALVMGTGGKIEFENNIVSNNSFQSENVSGGGGFYLWGDENYNGSILLNSNTIKENNSSGGSTRGYGWGGGIYIEDTNPLICNNLILNNSSGEGGGIFVSSSNERTVLINNTISQNEARFGGGLYNRSDSLILINTILWQNNAKVLDNSHEIFDSKTGIIPRSSLVEGGWMGDKDNVIDMDPKFVDAENGDFHLTEISPCVGNGVDEIQIDGILYTSPQNDCEGNKRPCIIDDYVDMGAFESPYAQVVNIVYNEISPLKFALNQNYPNPFNPSTTINYQLPITNYVNLSIYNLLGQKVVTLVSENQLAGNHQVNWDATGYPSGVYYYRIDAGEYQQVRKMILLR